MSVYSYLSGIKFTSIHYARKFFALYLIGVISIVLLFGLTYYLCSIHSEFTNLSLAVSGLYVVLISIMIYRLMKQLTEPVNEGNVLIHNYKTLKQLPKEPLVFHDELGQLLTTIQDVLQEMDHSLTEKSDMIELLSHDLRSPVARIQGISSLIKMDDPEQKDEYADLIATECKSLLTLMENILLMFKEGTHAFEPQIVNLHTLISESVQFFNIAAGDKQLTFNVDLDETIQINVQEQLFVQALRNILGNAIKFSPVGKSIFITATRQQNEISLKFKDEGMGLGQTDLVKIFDRFTTSGKKGTKGEKSIGLGLYLSKKILEKQGGTLHAESPGVNQGATFIITLPLLITKKPK